MSYVDERFYERVVKCYAAWPGAVPEVREPGVIAECRMLLEREARLIDEARFEDWLALYAPECLYWVPATRERGDPRREVAVCFDDRRRLEDRVYRLRTGHAWSQTPTSRTVHFVSNVEVFEGPMVRSNFLISEFRSGESRLWSGWYGHRLTRTSSGLSIEVKQVNLIDCDQNLRNPSILF